MQSEIHFVSGDKVRVDMDATAAQQALSKMKADASGLVPMDEATGRPVLVNPSLVTHVTSLGK